MRAIYKKELRMYATSMIGYVFVSFFLAIIGLYFYLYNISYGVPNFEYVLSSVTFSFLVLVPIITMKSMAEEKKQKTDQLLLTTPISTRAIVLGKYASLMSLYGIVVLVAGLYPLILTRYGSVNLKSAYAALFGFYLLGGALMAIGLFVSTCTENQIIAAIITFIIVLISTLMEGIARLFPTDHKTGWLVFAVLVLLLSCITYIMMHNLAITIITAVFLEVLLGVLFVLRPQTYDGLIVTVFDWFSIIARFDTIVSGILDLSTYVYDISIIFVFLFLSIQSIRKRTAKQTIRSGAYTTLVTTFTIAIVVLVNLCVGKVHTSIDLSSNAMFSLTDETKAMAKQLDSNITIYYLVEPGNENEYYKNLANEYAALSSKIKVEYKDPVLYPTFATKYTKDDITQNSVIVVNESNGRSKYIDSSKMKETQIDYQTYASYDSAIDFEGQVTSAIQYVINEQLPIYYQVTGHGEQELGTTFVDLLNKQNIELKSLATLKIKDIPDDCQLLILSAPTSDYSEEEIQMVRSYLTAGGKAIVFVDYTTNECNNFMQLLEYYGVAIEDGIIMEGDYDYMVYQKAPYIIPKVDTSVDLLSEYNSRGKLLVAPFSVGLKLLDTRRSSITTDSILTTSDEAYSKVDLQSETLEREEGDIKGPFSIGLWIQESYNQVETQLLVLGCPKMMDDGILSSPSYDNYEWLGQIVNAMSDSDIQTVSIPAKQLETSYLVLTTAQQNIWFYTAFLLVPSIILIAGIVVVVIRRKRGC